MAKEKKTETNKVQEPCGCGYKPPEVIAAPEASFNGEKADVFAVSFVLIAIYTLKRFSNKEQA